MLDALDGRGRSKAKNVWSGRAIAGARSGSGLEHWFLSGGTKPQDVEVRALLVVHEYRQAEYCSFIIRGAVRVFVR